MQTIKTENEKYTKRETSFELIPLLFDARHWLKAKPGWCLTP
jgi:hypothetical protein